MADDIKIRDAEGTWVVRAGGAVLGESESALEVSRGDHPFVIYFPRGDIAMAFLERSDHTSECPTRGTASYFSIVTKSTVLSNAAWSYEDPKPGMEALKDHVAFEASGTVTVEQL